MTHCSPNLFPCPLGTHSPTVGCGHVNGQKQCHPFWTWSAKTHHSILHLPRGQSQKARVKDGTVSIGWIPDDWWSRVPHPTLCQLDLMWMSNKLLLGQATEGSGYIFLVAGTHNCSVFFYILDLSIWHPFITRPIILTIFFYFLYFWYSGIYGLTVLLIGETLLPPPPRSSQFLEHRAPHSPVCFSYAYNQAEAHKPCHLLIKLSYTKSIFPLPWLTQTQVPDNKEQSHAPRPTGII